jgi:hypothetical protein
LNRAGDFEEAEDEYPALLAAVIPSQGPLSGRVLPSTEGMERVTRGAWRGRANRLSSSHVEWSIIAQAEQAVWKARTQTRDSGMRAPSPVLARSHECSAERIILQRRSCLALDGTTSIQASQFFAMLARTVPALSPVPFDAFQASEVCVPRIHLALFVHRVEGLQPGLYLLARRPDAVDKLRAAMHSRFSWLKPAGCPSNHDLFLLEAGDFRRVASSISCGQAIGGDGVFSLGMLAEFEEPLRILGPWFYRRLFWEAGLIGQILYLEAEAAGIRSTGIGCYFDDPMHELLGLSGTKFQDLYHFTVGGPVEDTRLTTEPAYDR